MVNSSAITTILSLLLFTSYFFLISTKASYESLECMNEAFSRLVHAGNRVEGIFFVPDDPVKKILLGLIYHEKYAIKAALYQLTDADILKALLDARNRGVIIEVITDKSCLQSKHEKISTLRRHGIKVYVYDKAYSIMHNKIWIFGRNLCNKALLFSGSANATMTGTTRNEENVMVIDRPDVVRAYSQKFDQLRQKIISMKKQKRFEVSESPYEWFFQILKNLAYS